MALGREPYLHINGGLLRNHFGSPGSHSFPCSRGSKNDSPRDPHVYSSLQVGYDHNNTLHSCRTKIFKRCTREFVIAPYQTGYPVDEPLHSHHSFSEGSTGLCGPIWPALCPRSASGVSYVSWVGPRKVERRYYGLLRFRIRRNCI